MKPITNSTKATYLQSVNIKKQLIMREFLKYVSESFNYSLHPVNKRIFICFLVYVVSLYYLFS